MYKYNSVKEFADNYDAFILDIWGVIHDGEKAYPGALECMQKLKAASKEVIFVSNAPRRASRVKKALAKFGVREELYLDAVSSGEIAYQYFSIFSGQPNFADSKLANYLYIGPPKDADLLKGLNYKEVDDAGEANFALVTGFDEDDSILAEKMPQIKAGLTAGLKMYCINPDLIVVRQDGSKCLCAGVIGEYYQEHGGNTEFIGKPWPAIYQYAIKKFSKPGARICAIGDSLTTDIKGANNAGIDAVLVLGGILKAENEPLETLIKKTNATPTATVPKFSW